MNKHDTIEKIEYEIREICEEDYDRGYIACISELTKTGNISKEDFIKRLKLLMEKKDYKVYVAIEKKTGDVIGGGTLLIEHKFIRECASKGHIEDLVVLGRARGNGIGKALVLKLLEVSLAAKCYKTSLVCDKSNIGFYSKCGFSPKEQEMVIYHKK